MLKKILNTFFENLLILQINLYERMMYMGKVEYEGKTLEVSNLAVTYSHIITLNLGKTFAKAPERLKSDIAVCLIAYGYPELVTNEEYLAQAQEKIAEAEANME